MIYMNIKTCLVVSYFAGTDVQNRRWMEGFYYAVEVSEQAFKNHM
jgi:hypothetical protein